MASLDHPHIVRLIALYEDASEFRIVTELMSGGELFDQIVSRSSYSEREACEVVRTLAEAIAYLHGRGIVHRGKFARCSACCCVSGTVSRRIGCSCLLVMCRHQARERAADPH
jgi:hypothetical protein